VAALLGVLLLSACTENAQLFSSLDEPTEPVLATVASGSLVAEDEYLEVQIDYPDDGASRATRMVVELRDPAGVTHGRVEFDRDQLAEPTLPPVQLPDPADGVYTLVVEAWINDQILFADRRQIFVLSDPPRLESLTIHPTSIHTEMQALALAEIAAPVGTSPYLRWLFDGNEVLQGYLAEGYDRVILDGGERDAGAYSVALEIYPWGPDEGAVIDGSTVLTAESDVYVHAELPLSPPESRRRRFGEVVRYYSFDGTHRAWVADAADAPAESAVSAEITGEAYLDMTSGTLGLRVGPEATVAVPLGRIPADGMGYIVEFSVALPVGGRVAAESGVWIGDVDALPGNASSGESGEVRTVELLVEEGAAGVEIRPLLADSLGPAVPVSPIGDQLTLTFVGPTGGELFIDEVAVATVDAGDLRSALFEDALQNARTLVGVDGTVTAAWPEGWPEEDSSFAPDPGAPGILSDAVVLGGPGSAVAWYRDETEESTFPATPLPEFRLRRTTDQIELVDRFGSVVDVVPLSESGSGEAALETWRVRWPGTDSIETSRDDRSSATAEPDDGSSPEVGLDLLLDETETETPIVLVSLPSDADREWTIAPDATEADFPVLLGSAAP